MDAYLGEIRIFAGNFAPQDWAFCDGRQMPINGNEALYSLIGVTFGGDGRTNFNLPDYRSRLVVGASNTNPPPTPLTSHAIGSTGGAESVSLTEANMPAHTHTLMASSKAADNSKLTNGAALGSTTAPIVSYIPSTATVSKVLDYNAGSIQPTGSSMPHENRMPSTALNFIICLKGIFPTA